MTHSFPTRRSSDLPVFGGEGKMNVFEVEGQRLYAPQGSNDFCLPTEAARRIDFVHPYWDEVGLPSDFGFARGQSLGGIKVARDNFGPRSEEHTSELQSLMRISYAVFCLKKK